jgi:hypothetical protein
MSHRNTEYCHRETGARAVICRGMGGDTWIAATVSRTGGTHRIKGKGLEPVASYELMLQLFTAYANSPNGRKIWRKWVSP